jgi:glutamate dehydrogenase (NAD(P)+)
MVQDSYSFFWDEDLVHQRLDQKLMKAYHSVREAIKEKNVHPRLAAMVVGVARIAEACKLRGWV